MRIAAHKCVSLAQHKIQQMHHGLWCSLNDMVVPSFRSKLSALKCRKADLKKELLSKMNLPYGKIQLPATPVQSSEEELPRNMYAIESLIRSL